MPSPTVEHWCFFFPMWLYPYWSKDLPFSSMPLCLTLHPLFLKCFYLNFLQLNSINPKEFLPCSAHSRVWYVVFHFSTKPETRIPPHTTIYYLHPWYPKLCYLLITIFFPAEPGHTLRTSHNIALGAIITWLELVCKGRSMCCPSLSLITS